MGKITLATVGITFVSAALTFGAQTTVKATAKGVSKLAEHVAHVIRHPAKTTAVVAKHVSK